jgi:hypothetical protein
LFSPLVVSASTWHHFLFSGTAQENTREIYSRPAKFFRSVGAVLVREDDAVAGVGTGKNRADLKIRIRDRLIRVILNSNTRSAKEPLRCHAG